MKRLPAFLVFLTVLVAVAALPTVAQAQAHHPLVTMSVTPQGGQATQLTAPDSGVATLKMKDGTEIGFRPTIQDSRPWNQITVTIVRMPTEKQPTQELGRVDVKKGASPVPSNTTPAFRIAVTTVSEPK
jgi:hypothetical protein